MSTLGSKIVEAGLADRPFNEKQLARAVGGSDARRYGLVNRALKDGTLMRVRRGVYVLGSAYEEGCIHPFALAQCHDRGSYISFESALSHHGWIPEAVYEVSSVTPGRKTRMYEHEQMGRWTFHPLALNEGTFFQGVQREKLEHLTGMVAKPLRALMDLVALRKLEWQGLGWLESGMRIDIEHLVSLKKKDFDELRGVYMYRAPGAFLADLETAVTELKDEARASHGGQSR